MIFGYVGYDCVDIILANARMLVAAGKKVHIVDCTKKSSVLLTAGMEEFAERQEGVYHGVYLSAEDAVGTDTFDYEIYYFGYNTGHPAIGRCELLYFVTDMIPYNAQLLSQVASADGTVKKAILKNAIAVKYKEKFLTDMMEQGIKPEDTFVLMYDEIDYRNRCYLCIDAKSSLKQLSKGMQTLLIHMFILCETSYTQKEIKNLFKSA